MDVTPQSETTHCKLWPNHCR